MVDRYLLIGLRLGKLVEGFVDCWFGEPRLVRQVDAESPASPLDVAAQAAELRQALPDADLSPARSRFLAAQLKAMECSARRLAGTPMSFQDEVRNYFEVDITLGDSDRYAEVHGSISELLPGTGSLRERVEAFYERNLVPPDRFGRAVRAVSGELRARAVSMLGLPAEETVEYTVVHDKPWNAFNSYLGGFRSSVALNANAGGTIAALPLIPAHESYPGHHTEHCLKEARLVNQLGHREHVLAMVNTPQCLLAEGTAELAISALLGAGWGDWTAGLLADQDVHIEGELVERMLNLVRLLLPARQDAAILLHDRGVSAEDAVGYLERWLLLPPDRAEQIVRFLTDPLWRAYSVTYVEGARLVGDWLSARAPTVPVMDRYRLLLEEQALPGMLAEEVRRARLSPAAGPAP